MAEKELKYAESIDICRQPQYGPVIRTLENEVIRNIAAQYIKKGTSEQLQAINSIWQKRSQYQQAIATWNSLGITNEDTLKYCLTIYLVSLQSLKQQHLAVDVQNELLLSLLCKAIALSINPALALVIGTVGLVYDLLVFAFGSSEHKVLGPLIHILNQRIILDAFNIRLEEYYE